MRSNIQLITINWLVFNNYERLPSIPRITRILRSSKNSTITYCSFSNYKQRLFFSDCRSTNGPSGCPVHGRTLGSGHRYGRASTHDLGGTVSPARICTKRREPVSTNFPAETTKVLPALFGLDPHFEIDQRWSISLSHGYRVATHFQINQRWSIWWGPRFQGMGPVLPMCVMKSSE